MPDHPGVDHPPDGRFTDTRERILRAAEDLYHAGGYDHINLQVIADQVGVSKTALFHHFKNKQELFFAVLMRLLDHYRELARTAFQGETTGSGPATTMREKLRRMMRYLTYDQPFDMMRFMREEYILLTAEQQAALNLAWHTSVFDPLRQVLEDGVRSGEARAPGATGWSGPGGPAGDLAVRAFAFLQLCMLLSQPTAVTHVPLFAAGWSGPSGRSAPTGTGPAPDRDRTGTGPAPDLPASGAPAGPVPAEGPLPPDHVDALMHRMIDALLDIFLYGVARAPDGPVPADGPLPPDGPVPPEKIP